MKIIFYRSAVCPRCLLAARELKKLQEEYDFMVSEVEVTTNPLKTWKAGIRMIPALECNGEVLAGLYLGSAKIRRFIEKLIKKN